MGMSRGETKGDGDPHTLESLQKQVDGSYIETIRLGAGIVLITDEEGKLNGSKPNFDIIDDVKIGRCFLYWWRNILKVMGQVS